MKEHSKAFEPSPEDWENVRRYQNISTEKKLEWLDRYREFIFEVWKNNPSLRKTYEKFRE